MVVKHLTLEEIKTLAAFYASPVCKSAAKKMEGLIPEMMTKLEAEMIEMEKKRGGPSGAGSKPTTHSRRLSTPSSARVPLPIEQVEAVGANPERARLLFSRS